MGDARDGRSGPEPGSNLKGSAAGAAWTYLLDALALDRVVCIGEPSAAALRTLERVAEHVVIVAAPGATGHGTGTSEPAALATRSAGLVYLVQPSRAACEVASRALADDGVLYVETYGGRRERQLHAWLLDVGLHVNERFWLTPATGEARSAVPASDGAIRRYFVSRGVIVASLHRVMRVVERRIAGIASRRRTGLFASRSERRVHARVPRYVSELADGAGRSLMGYRVGLSARGQYNSRKVILYLFPDDAPRPDLIVKTTRDGSLNERLENEERVLRRVDRERLVPSGTAPRVAFGGEHGGLRIVGETVMEGTSLWTSVSTAAAVGAYAWLTSLAEHTARYGDDAAGIIDARLADLVDGLDRGYSLRPWERTRLKHWASIIRAHAGRIPLVLAHGDAAAWNSVRLADGRVGFLDWEAAGFDSLPLWDLWYFARSRHMTATRLRRRLGLAHPDVLSAIRSDTELKRALQRCVSAIRIPPDAVPALFILCWADRAMREVTRLDANGLASGHYISLVRQLLADHT